MAPLLERAFNGVRARSVGFDLVESSLRFLDGAAFFTVAVAMPFFVLEGAGRFLEGAGSGAEVSVDGTGTEESRSGVCSDLTLVNGFKFSAAGEEGRGVPSCLMTAGEESIPSARSDMVEDFVWIGGGGWYAVNGCRGFGSTSAVPSTRDTGK